MKNLLTSAILTLAAVPFLMAAPAAVKAPKQASSTSVAAKPKVQKKHVRKAKSHTAAPAVNSAAPVAK